MLKLLIFLFLLTTTFAQSPFWKIELMESAASTPSTPDILTDLVALWQDGDTVDVTGRGNDLSAYGGFSVTASTLAGFDSVWTFDGIDGYLSRESTTDLQLGGTDFTRAVWVKQTDNNNYHSLYYKGTAGFGTIEHNLLLANGDALYYVDNSEVNGYTETTDWTLYVVTVTAEDGEGYRTVKIYDNGIVVFESYQAWAILQSTNDFYVAISNNLSPLKGSIAQLAIYKRALTQEQITYLYNGGDGRLIDVVSTPRNIAAVGDANKITLTWTDPSQSDFDSVRVYAGTTANPTTWVASVAKGVQSYVDTNYSYNTIRHYRLKALTTSGDTSNYTSSVNDTVMMNLGSELVTNGTFDADASWFKLGASTISGGTGNVISDGTLSQFYQTVACTTSSKYYCTFSAVRNSGSVVVYYNVEGNSTLGVISASGSYTVVFTAGDTNKYLAFKRVAACNISFDNVSLKKILNP